MGNNEPLTKRIEKFLQALDIIFEYDMDIWLMSNYEYKDYVRIREKAHIFGEEIYKDDGTITHDVISEKEYNFVKEIYNGNKSNND